MFDVLGRIIRNVISGTFLVGVDPIELVERIFAFFRIRYDTGVLLNGLFGRDDTTFDHEIVDPTDLTVFESLEGLVLHRESLVEGDSVLNHFVDARVLLLERGFDDADHRVRIAAVIVRTAGPFDHADVEANHTTRHGINLAFGDLDVLLTHDVVAQLFELHRQDTRDELFGKHFHLRVVTVLDLGIEVAQLLAYQLVERVVVVEQVEI